MGGIGMEMFKHVTHEMAKCRPSESSVWIRNILCGILNHCTHAFIGVNGNFMVIQLMK